MKTLPPGLQAHLDSGATTLAWCWRVMRQDGIAFGFTDHDRDVAFDGTIFEAASGFTGTDIEQSVGLSIDNLDVTGALQSDRLSETDLAAGLFDDAQVEIWRANWSAPEQRILMMRGSIGEVRRGDSAFTAELRGLAHRLDQKRGRTFQYGCDATLGDRRCTVDPDAIAYKGAGEVLSASARYLFTASGLDGFQAGWFDGGHLIWTSGANEGHGMEVKRFTLSGATARIELWRSTVGPISASDNFTITAGCDKTFATCKAKFANQINFRGFPHMPGNSLLMAYPSAADLDNNGSSIS